MKHVGAYFMNRFSDSVCSNLRVAVFEALQRRPLEEMAQAREQGAPVPASDARGRRERGGRSG